MTRWWMQALDVTTGRHSPPVSGPPSTPSSPAVMLSPNATNLVAVSIGGASTVTVNEHASARCSTSVAVHEIVVVPMPRTVPDWIEQLVKTGGLSLTTVGLGTGTAIVSPLLSGMVCDAGQEIFGGPSVGGGVGLVLLAHAPTSSAQVMTTANRFIASRSTWSGPSAGTAR